ncbi:hypothetical protein MtrunA17_Chr8g0368591 [Medicago truncatula]|uniref:Uncharacterized protein n=1 Tax=Medicago truncatula TaxID=3880 RepID=A0A396GKM8_MEDTR|nr:hypothetical protein MtrunA17_Chr8g0368591 [Medicago truncatula]
MEKRVSLVWLLCKSGKKVSFWWDPCSETFSPLQRRKLGIEYLFGGTHVLELSPHYSKES